MYTWCKCHPACVRLCVASLAATDRLKIRKDLLEDLALRMTMAKIADDEVGISHKRVKGKGGAADAIAVGFRVDQIEIPETIPLIKLGKSDIALAAEEDTAGGDCVGEWRTWCASRRRIIGGRVI